MVIPEFNDTICAVSQTFVQRICPRCNWFFPEAWDVKNCGYCNLSFAAVKPIINKSIRRCHNCQNIMPDLREQFCRKCLCSVKDWREVN